MNSFGVISLQMPDAVTLWLGTSLPLIWLSSMTYPCWLLGWQIEPLWLFSPFLVNINRNSVENRSRLWVISCNYLQWFPISRSPSFICWSNASHIGRLLEYFNFKRPMRALEPLRANFCFQLQRVRHMIFGIGGSVRHDFVSLSLRTSKLPTVSSASG
jgi:hypothetical protein